MTPPSPKDPLLWRFSLYGFLKNQQYYEPFFLLVLLSKGLNYFQIGLLYSFREICVLIMGIPAGFLADLYGRRSSIVFCFVAYILAFLGFALTQQLHWLYVSMFAFAIGESFRSGTHKAMIFHHLRLTGQESLKIKVYGFTRSWSKMGSALSSLLSGLLVFFSGSYARIFLFTIPPYLLNMINVGRYPAVLEGQSRAKKERISPKQAFYTMFRETWVVLKNRELRSIFLESAALQATSKTIRDYIQPLVVTALAGSAMLGSLGSFSTQQQSALILALLYFSLNMAAAFASRKAYWFERLDQSRVPFLWLTVLVMGVAIALGSHWKSLTAIAVIGFICVVLLENIWRPLFMDRMDAHSDSEFGAAVLSVEAQFHSFGIMLLAPIIGKWVDSQGLPAVGIAVAAIALGVGLMRQFVQKRP